MKALRNIWYQGGWCDEISEDSSLARTIVETNIVFFRDKEGKVIALRDRCPHKFAPLSAGRVCNGSIVCGYHGVAFGNGGQCTHNPHGSIPKRLAVDAFPVTERHRAFWVWLGDPELANPDLIPDLSFIDETPEHAAVKGYMPTACDYQLLTDNILDLSHADFLHPTTLGGMMVASEMTLTEEDGVVSVMWVAKDINTPVDFPAPIEGKADSEIVVKWYPPALMVLTARFVPAGQEMTDNDYSIALHNMVPDTNGQTNYFFCVTRVFEHDNHFITEALRKAANQAFVNEDKPMLEKQQRVIGDEDYENLKPVILSIDAAGVRARLKLKKLIAAESEADVAASKNK